MKLKFDGNLQYQKQAIDSVVNIFQGQSVKQSNFTVSFSNYQLGLLIMSLV